jgi:hypothetical protein
MSKSVTDKGTQVWQNDMYQYHRVDGPATVWIDGTELWYINGKLHRTDGPAIYGNDRHQLWFIDDIRYYNNKSFQEAASLSDEDMIAIVLKYGDVK